MFIPSPDRFLSEILQSRGLTSVTADPLFTYQLQQSEYQDLKQIVVNFIPKKNSASGPKHEAWSACFVLWCSEWYRREYQAQDGWSWSAIWKELNFELHPTDIREFVPLGMEKFWRRPIRYYTERRNFLGSIFIEGGLPFQLISSKDNKFGDLIRKVLANYYQVDLLGISVGALIKRYVDYLPTVFSEDESIELISSVVRNLMGLADKIDANPQALLPSEQLDKLIPNWRNQFPIPLDNTTGRDLLNNWLRGASFANTSIKKFQKKLSCKHYFDLSSATFFSEISMPQKLYFNFGKSDVGSSRLDLEITEGKVRRANFGSVYAQFESERTLIKTRKKGVRLPRNNIHSKLYVDIVDAGISIEQSEIQDSSISLGDVPIGFVIDEDKYLHIGQSSFSTKHPTIYLLNPAGLELEIINGTCTKVDDLVIEDKPFDWCIANGDMRFSHENNRYRICTNSTTNTRGMLHLVGKEISWESKPSSVYLGMPKLNALDNNTDSTYGLTTFIDNKPVNTIQEYEQYGTRTLTVKNKDNDTLLRRKIAVLPSDLNISFNCESKKSVITVSTQRPISANLLAEDANVSMERTNTARRFMIEPNGLPPAKVKLLIQATLECEPIELILPYPASGIYGYNAEGKILGRELTINQLLGSEVFLYSDKKFTEKFKLEFSLLPLRTNSPSHNFAISVADKPQTLSLYSFKEKIIELLSLSDSLDAKVQIRISNSSNDKTYVIRRFASNILIDHMDDLISFENSSINEGEHFPLAMKIAEPERKPVKLQHKMLGSIELDIYEIDTEMKKFGPWLIIPNQNTDVDFRPTFYATNTELDLASKEAQSLQTAIKAYHPSTAPNVIAEFIHKMSVNIEHSSWDYFRNLWENFGYLPLSTFEAWKALINIPSAMTMILFKFEMNEEFTRRVDAEFPMLWELIPLDNWISAKNAFERWLLKLGASQKLIDEQVNKMFERFSLSVPSYPAEAIELIKGKSVEQRLSAQQAKMIINTMWLQDLIRDNSDADWPIDLKYEIDKAVSGLDDLKSLINIQNSWQYSVVLYPLVAAAISAGKLEFADIFSTDSQTTFSLKRLRDFDLNWFSSMFSYGVSYFSHSE